MPNSDREKQREYMASYRQRPGVAARQRARRRELRAANPEKTREDLKRWRDANPERARAAKRRYYERHPQATWKQHLRRWHGMTPDEFAEMWERQGGNCYLCEQPLTMGDVHVDHDHRHCSSKEGSCRICRRGLSHPPCNTGIGHAGDDPAKLRLWADNLEAAQRAATERIDKSAPAPRQDLLF